MRVLITGISSAVGHCLARTLPANDACLGIYHNNPVSFTGMETVRADLTDRDGLLRLCTAFKPDAIVHVAAISIVSVCEKDPELADQINHLAPRTLAEYAAAENARMVHIVTDMIFDGDKEGRYQEEDEPSPVTVYGRAKWEGEKAVQKVLPEAAILRPALMFGFPPAVHHGFLYWLMNQVKSGKSVSLFSDQTRTPLFAWDLCDIIWQCLENTCSGIYHLGGPRCMNRVEIGREYLVAAGFPETSVTPGLIQDVDLGYAIQKNLCLDHRKAAETFQYRFTSYQEGLKKMLKTKPLQTFVWVAPIYCIQAKASLINCFLGLG